MLDHFKARDGVRVGYYVDDFTDPWRNNTPIVMLHAEMGHARRFYAMVPTLCRQFRTLRMDLRGHGETGAQPGGAVGMDHLVNDVIDLMDLLGHPVAHLVGNSAGGYVAQQLAMRHPDRVKSLSLFSAPPGPGKVNFLSAMAPLEASGDVSRITCPVLVVAPGGQAAGDAGIADVTVKRYEGYPHNLCDAAPERCAQEVLQFLQARFPGEYSPLRV
jgi:pimeloyl-ACP methyl ester carboxylesterase